MRKYIIFIVFLSIIVFIAFNFFPIVFTLVKILIGLGVLIIFGVGFWIGTYFNKKQ